MANLLFKVILPALLVLFAVFALLRRTRPELFQRLEGRLDRRFFLFVALLGGLCYALSLALVTSLPVCIDAVEVTVAEVSFLVLHGKPIYTALLSPERYSLLYGPMCYLPFSASIIAFGASLSSLKAAVVLLNVSLFVVLLALFRRLLLDWSSSFMIIGALAACFMMKEMPTLQIRGDITLALSIALALFAVELRPRLPSAMLLSFAAAIALDIKFTAIVYLLIPIYVLWKKHGNATTALTIALSGVFALLPFSSSSVSLRNYLAWLHEASHHPLSAKLFSMNVVAAIIILAPSLILFYALHANKDQANGDKRSERTLLAVLILSMLGSVVVGSKIGAGRSHLVPSSIVAFYVAVIFWRSVQNTFTSGLHFYRTVFLGYAAVLLIPAISQVRDLWSICYERRAYAQAVNRDIATTENNFATQSLEIGYNDQADSNATVAPLSLFKPQLVFRGGPVTVDAAAMFDMGLSGLKTPGSTIAALASCTPEVWLVPKGGRPFAMVNAYSKDVPDRFPDSGLFGIAFQKAFNEAYHFSGSSQYYDLYSCSK